MRNNDVLKGILILGVILYVISPLDLCPGPIDDFLMILLTMAIHEKEAQRKEKSVLYSDSLEGSWRDA